MKRHSWLRLEYYDPVPARRIQCRVAAGGASSREDSSDASKRKFGHRIPYIQCQPEESDAALRREALRAERILSMCPRGSLDTGYHTSSVSQKNPMPRCGGRRFEPRGFFRCVQEEVWTQDTIHPVSARRIRCRVAAGGASSREDSSDVSKRKFGHIIP